MSTQIIYKDRTKAQGIQANLDQNDMNKVLQEVGTWVIEVNNREFPATKPGLIILIGASRPKSYLSPERTRELVDMAVDTFRILYYDKQWTLSRCLGKLKKVCFHRLDNPGTWDVDLKDGTGMYLARDGEQDVENSYDLADTTPWNLKHPQKG